MYSLSFLFFLLQKHTLKHVPVWTCVFACVRLGLRVLDVPLPVMMHQHVDNFLKQVRLLRAKEASSDLVNSLFEFWQAVVVFFSVVPEQKDQ